MDDGIVYQTNCLTKLHPNYLIDGIRLRHTDTILIKSLENHLQIKEYKFVRNIFSNWIYDDFANEGLFIKYSDFPYVVNEYVLDSKRRKNKFWKTFSSNNISSIEKIDKEKSIKLYGKRGEYGVIRIKTKN